VLGAIKSISFDKIGSLSEKKIWLLFFSYILIVTLLIQLIILPYLLPDWHAGDGLLVGGDWVGFHRDALKQAAEVKEFGWSAFTLYLDGQFVAGIASFLYILFIPLPAVVLPLNAILHATAGLILFKILSQITQDRRISLAGSTLFIIFPSALRWVSQMHNDSYSILGALMFLYGWLQLDKFLKDKKFRTFLIAFSSIILGLFIIALVRAYLIDVYFMASLILGLYLILRMFISFPLKSAVAGAGFFILLVLAQGYLGEEVIQYKVRELRLGRPPNSISGASGNNSSPRLPGNFSWEESSFLPDWFDNQVAGLVGKRFKVIRNWSDGSSGIDTEVDLSSSLKTFLYTPRALQIALLAPFPTDWFDEGTKAPSNFMKRVASLETSFVYVLFLFLLAGINKWRSSSAMHLLLLFSLFFLTIFAIATPNVGNLYRFRYPYFSVLVSLGGASLAHFGPKLRSKIGKG
jgi:hypothetical protein